MKKSNKVSVFYVLSCLVLLLGLTFGGVYGIYLSVGLNFVRSSLANITEGSGMTAGAGAQNVSFGGTVNFPKSMIGVIILSIVLIVLAVLDFISLIKQVVLFKQFKIVRESKLEQKIEKKVKSKGGVIFFAVLVDILSLAAGIAGIFVNMRSLAGGNFVWAMYAVDALVALFAVVSFVLLIIKLKQAKNYYNSCDCKATCEARPRETVLPEPRPDYKIDTADDINDLENKLLKLRYLKASKLISPEEYQKLRERFFYREGCDDVDDSDPKK